MMKSGFAVAAFALAIGGAPVLASAATPATPPAGAAGSAAASQPSSRPPAGTATIKPSRGSPQQNNPVLAANGEVRVNKMIGSDVYNKNDQKLGTVDGVLVNRQGTAYVVIETTSLQNGNNNNNNGVGDNRGTNVAMNNGVNNNGANGGRARSGLLAPRVANGPNYNGNNNGPKKVVVPWSAFEFGNTKINGDNQVLMPGMTEAKLHSLSGYSYQNTKEKSAGG